MKKETLIITAISIALIFGFLFLVYSFSSKPATTVFPEVNKIRSLDQTKWSKGKKRILVEYSDFQCPACRNFHTFFKQMESSVGPDSEILKKVTFVYRHFPLLTIHQNALLAAYTSEAAGKQDKFWQMHDALFESQDSWAKSQNPRDFFINLAVDLKLDTERFKSDLDSKEIKEKVQSNMLSGEQARVNATPTFFLDGRRLDQIRTFDEFKQILLQN